MHRCFPPWTIEHWVAGRTVLNFGDASRGTDRRHHTGGKSTRKRGLAILAAFLRLIAREQLGFRNLFFLECGQFALLKRQRILENTMVG